jgi:TP53 regulating kinase and related kinases
MNFECEDKRPKVQLPPTDLFTPIAQGAEAILYQGSFFGKPCVLKQRIPKTYRHPLLDQRLLRQRTGQEIRCLGRLLNTINVPRIFLALPLNHSFIMELIQGRKVKDILFESNQEPPTDLIQKLAKIIATMHNANVIHGDLTTSNMLLTDDGKMYLIDFGLAQVSKSPEEKAVDLYILERSFNSIHSTILGLFDLFLGEYYNQVNDKDNIKAKLDEVQKRGRKRSMVG